MQPRVTVGEVASGLIFTLLNIVLGLWLVTAALAFLGYEVYGNLFTPWDWEIVDQGATAISHPFSESGDITCVLVDGSYDCG